MKKRSILLLLIALAVLLGLALRLLGLTAGVLSLDESYTMVEAESSLGDIFRLAPTDPNPPLTSLVYKLWTWVFGASELAWEMLSALLGAGAIALLAWLGWRAIGAEAGVISAWLLAVSPLHINFSQQVRSYALAVALSLLACGVLLSHLEQPSRGRAFGFLAAAWLFVNTHYYGILVVCAWMVGALLAAPRQNARRLVGLSLALLTISLPTLYCLYRQYTTYYSFDWIAAPEPWLFLVLLYTLAEGLGLALALGALATAGAWALLRERRLLSAAVLLSWLLLPAILAFAASAVGRPFLHARYSVLWLAPVPLLAGRGVLALPRRWPQLLAVALVGLAAVPLLAGYYRSRTRESDFKAALGSIEDRYRTGDVVLHLSKSSYVPALFYHGGRLEEYFLAGTPSSNVMRYWMKGPTQLEPAELARFRRVFIVRPPDLPKDALAALLRSSEFRAHAPTPVSTDEAGTVLLFELGAR